MENMEQPINNDLKIGYDSYSILQGASKWAKIVSIISLCMLALVLLMIIFIASSMPQIFSIFMIIFYAIMLCIGALPYIFMYKFATETQEALFRKDENLLSGGFKSLKNYFLILGIFVIISIVFVIFSLIIMLVAGTAIMSSLPGIGY